MAQSLTPAMRQYLAVKQRYPDAVLFFRMGDFYEMFFDDAVEAAGLLDLTLTSRNKNNPNPVPMAGIPYHAAAQYIGRLLKAGKKVAICEQMEPPGTKKGPVRREVVRVVTPGVVLEEGLLESAGSNFLACVVSDETGIGLVLLDASTGEFRGTLCDDTDVLKAELARWSPREVVVGENDKIIKKISGLGLILSVVENRPEPEEGISPMVLGKAVSMARSYLSGTGVDPASVLRDFQRYMPGDRMYLPPQAIRSLELFGSLSGKGKHSVLKAIDATQTPMGGRLLRSWLAGPLMDKQGINQRLDQVQQFVNRPQLVEEIRQMLRPIGDMARAFHRLMNGFGSPRDLVVLVNGVPAIHRVNQRLEQDKIPVEPVDSALLDWANLVAGIIKPDPPINWREGGVFLPAADPDLARLIQLSEDSKTFISQYEAEERKRTGIANLRVKYNRVFGYMIEVTKSQTDKVPSDYIRRQTLTNAERYKTQRLEELERDVLSAQERRKAMEIRLFEGLCQEVGRHAAAITAAVDWVARVDVFRGLGEKALRLGLVRPRVFNDRRLHIKQGRHPVVEAVLGPGEFVPNDLDMDDDFMVILTGPNMSGKSTFMRQVAIIVILAQIGSFVPADEAEIGLVDAVLTRIGSGDDLAGGRSTFMVEMEEIAQILNRATGRSLLILDEVGRGTSTFDGLAIAWSTAEYIADRIQARTLLATHYHEMTKLAKLTQGIRNLSAQAKELNGSVVFLHTIGEGAADKSYGIEVAMLARVPDPVVERAREVLANLEMNEIDVLGQPILAKSRRKRRKKMQEEQQPDLFSTAKPQGPSPLETQLMHLDMNNMTPLNALNKLANLVEEAKKRYGP